MKNENDGIISGNEGYDQGFVKSVNRTITNVYSRGTYNPADVDT